jgi:prepilin-type N-terminal cleavage/methylation domain-containing protein
MNKGFTLVELILTILVMGIIALVSAQVLMRGVSPSSKRKSPTRRKDVDMIKAWKRTEGI